MTHTISSNQAWMPVLASLLMSLLLATAVCGQEEVLNSLELESNQITESTSVSAQPAAMQTELQTAICDSDCGSSAGQLAITSQSRHRELPVYVCPSDEIWLVSARQSHCAPSDLSRLQCSRLENGEWNPVQLDELVRAHSTDKTKVTMIYVHGNRTSLQWASSRGLQFYKVAFQTAKRPPMRFVIFACRSETERARFCVDYDIKSQRSVTVGKTFGKLLGRFEDREMVLGGYSLGAQVVLTALSQPELQFQDNRAGKFRVAILAPALNPCFIQSDLIDYPQNPLVHQTEVFLNCDDCAVKLSEKIARRRTKSSFRLQDLAGSRGWGLNPITIRNITGEVTKRHSIVNYGRSPSVNCKLAMLLNATFAGGTSIPVTIGESVDMEVSETETERQEVAATEPLEPILTTHSASTD
jgi:hypothetical protein